MNLIDTPGHVDFTIEARWFCWMTGRTGGQMEMTTDGRCGLESSRVPLAKVERALRVLDGAVLICCGVGGPRSKVTLVHSKFRLLGRVRTTIDSNPARHHPQKQLRCLQLRSRAKPSLLIDRWSDMRRLTLSICQPGGSPKWIKMVERLGTLGWSLQIH